MSRRSHSKKESPGRIRPHSDPSVSCLCFTFLQYLFAPLDFISCNSLLLAGFEVFAMVNSML
jgi:hypothetical protein